jgi:hypothetical protein
MVSAAAEYSVAFTVNLAEIHQANKPNNAMV